MAGITGYTDSAGTFHRGGDRSKVINAQGKVVNANRATVAQARSAPNSWKHRREQIGRSVRRR